MSVEDKLQKEIDDLENQLYSFKIKMSTEISGVLIEKKARESQDAKSNKNSNIEFNKYKKEELLESIKSHKEVLEKLNSDIDSNKNQMATDNNLSQKLAELRVKNQQLTSLVKDKKGKIAQQDRNLKKLQNKMIAHKNIQLGKKRVRQWISDPQEKEDSVLLQTAKERFFKAKEEWHLAISFYENKKFDRFFLVAYSALELAIKASYVALMEEEAQKDIEQLINGLFEKGLILNTTKLDNINRMVDQLKDGISVNPQANYRIQIYDFFKHNFKIMLIE